MRVTEIHNGGTTIFGEAQSTRGRRYRFCASADVSSVGSVFVRNPDYDTATTESWCLTRRIPRSLVARSERRWHERPPLRLTLSSSLACRTQACWWRGWRFVRRILARPAPALNRAGQSCGPPQALPLPCAGRVRSRLTSAPLPWATLVTSAGAFCVVGHASINLDRSGRFYAQGHTKEEIEYAKTPQAALITQPKPVNFVFVLL